MVKNLPANAGDVHSSLGWVRSSGEGNGSPLQYSCLENPTDRGAWQVVVQGVSKSWTQLSNRACPCVLKYMSFLLHFLFYQRKGTHKTLCCVWRCEACQGKPLVWLSCKVNWIHLLSVSTQTLFLLDRIIWIRIFGRHFLKSWMN